MRKLSHGMERTQSWLGVAVLAAFGIGAVPSRAHAFTYYAEYMDNWTGCEQSAATLSYTDDQIGQFVTAMDNNGHTRAGYWANLDVWASDLTDASFTGGDDQNQADLADIYALSSHGNATVDGGGFQSYSTPMCKANGTGSPTFDSVKAKWGGGSGPVGGRKLRWAMLLTCFSVDSDPANQWNNAMDVTQFEFVMGYRGLSADGESTDEVAGDWANGSIVGSGKFTATWFSATSDFWVDDTSGVLTGGTDTTDAINRYNNMNKNTARRAAGTTWPVFAWNWHLG